MRGRGSRRALSDHNVSGSPRKRLTGCRAAPLGAVTCGLVMVLQIVAGLISALLSISRLTLTGQKLLRCSETSPASSSVAVLGWTFSYSEV